MKIIVCNGLYFIGNMKDIVKELQKLSKHYRTLREVIVKNMQ